MSRARGPVLLLPFLFAVLLFPYGRAALHQEETPAFFLRSSRGNWIGLGQGFPNPGIHQFSDGATLRDVIEMTVMPETICPLPKSLLNSPLPSGILLDLISGNRECFEIQQGWLPAGQRVALGVPLHADRMALEDWESLPGVGPALAKAIEMNRQQNGDFSTLEDLERVRGIGHSRIATWKEFFTDR